MSNRRYATILLVIFAINFTALALEPVNREDWALENVLVVIWISIFAATYRRFQFSMLSYSLMFIFFSLHEIGSHYTYSLVPYDAWYQNLTGGSFNDLMGWDRNHFDRLVHFSFGLLLSYPLYEVITRIAGNRRFWKYFLPICLVMAASLTYEMIEWAAAEVFGGELGMAYLGTQGDVWDSHKDSLLATIGALLAMAIKLIVRWPDQQCAAK
jgi:putative membrane protein